MSQFVQSIDRPPQPLMTPAEAAQALHVAPRTVARWSDDGRITSVRTPGGHRRYRTADVQDLLAEQPG